MAKTPAAQALHITSRNLKGLQPSPGVEVVWDTLLPGFGLRTRGKSDESAWAWVFKYRHRATRKVVKVTLGKYGALTPDEARKAAKSYYEAARVPGADRWDKEREVRDARL